VDPESRVHLKTVGVYRFARELLVVLGMVGDRRQRQFARCLAFRFDCKNSALDVDDDDPVIDDGNAAAHPDMNAERRRCGERRHGERRHGERRHGQRLDHQWQQLGIKRPSGSRLGLDRIDVCKSNMCRSFVGNGNPSDAGSGGGKAMHELADLQAMLLVAGARDEGGNTGQGQRHDSDITPITVQNPTPQRKMICRRNDPGGRSAQSIAGLRAS
jgi:hypothetical protein